MSIRRLAATVVATLGAAVAVLACMPASSMASRVYARTGQFGESGEGQLSRPAGVAVNEATGEAYVVDQGNDRITIFNAGGEYVSQFDGGETPAKSFSSPSSIAIDNSSSPAKSNVYVADAGNNVIDIFDSSGKYLSQITGGSEPFSGLLNVAVDGFGHLWVYVSGGFVDEFSDNGSFVKAFETGRGSEPGFAVEPLGRTVDVVFGDTMVGTYDTATAEAQREFSEGVTALAISSSYILFVDTGSLIEEYGPLGEAVEKFGEGQLSGSPGVAVNGTDGTVYASSGAEPGAVQVFKLVVVPDVSTGGASNVQKTSATVSGTIDPEGIAATCEVEYGTSTSYGSSVPCSPVEVLGGETANVEAAMSALAASETYHYRVRATNVNGTVHGEDRTFSTFPAPIVGALSASFLTPNSAVLYATVDTQDGDTKYHFLYGPTGAYGSQAPVADVELHATMAGAQAVSQSIEGLQPGTTYHYAIVATNGGGTSQSPDMTFLTAQPAPPAVLTGGAGAVSQNAATISGTVDPRGVQTSYEFDLGTDTGYGTRVFGDAGTGSGVQTIALSMQSLAAGTTYHYRLTAKNVFGTTYGSDETFTTPGFQTALLGAPATSVLVPTPPFASSGTAGGTTKASAIAHTAQQVKNTKHKKKSRKSILRKKKHRGGSTARTHSKGRGN